MSGKYYVLDTNVILHHPHVLNALSNCYVVISDIVLEELDTKKSDNELGRNARHFTRVMDKLYLTNYYMAENDVKVIFHEYDGNKVKNDDKIIDVAYGYSQIYDDVEVLSNDGLVRIKSRTRGLVASEFAPDTFNLDLNMIYTGVSDCYLDGNLINDLYHDKFLSSNHIKNIELNPHMFLRVTSFSNPSISAIAKVTCDMKNIEILNPNINLWGFSPKNARQRMALELLLDPDIPLVTVIGKAGSGKTLLAELAALALSKDENLYKKIILTKPTEAMGKDIGYLPGGKEEKLAPWMQSYQDNLEVIFNGKDVDEIIDQLNIEIDALTYFRGRSIPDTFIIIDEAQNLTKHEVKTMITRAGEGAKIVLMGDPEQIDKPGLDSLNNGLTYVVNKFKGEDVAGHITLDKTVRSKLADVASNIL